MRMQRNFLLLAAIATMTAMPAMMPTLAQTPSAGPAATEKQSAASIPNLTGVWTHPSFPWFEPPASGPGPITNLVRWAGQGPAGPGGSLQLPPSKGGVGSCDRLG